MIEVSNLVKRYGRHTAVDDVSFTVKEGEIVGFLGPNGAGKTTTMNIMTGFISATEGRVSIAGKDILDEAEAAKAAIGYMPDNPPLYGEMLVDEFLNFVCEIKRVPKKARGAMLKEIKDTVRVTDMSRRLIRNLSKGYRQRVGLAQALVGYPPVIVMDEPTTGLDPRQIIEMRELIRKLGRKHTVILSSHNLYEVGEVCDRVMIINKGRIVAVDTPKSLSTTLSRGQKMLVRLKGERAKARAALTAAATVSEAAYAGSREPGTVDFEISGGAEADVREAVFNAAVKANMPILMLKSTDMSLEEVFLQITTGETKADGKEGRQ